MALNGGHSAGSSGHIDDHNLIDQALTTAAADAATIATGRLSEASQFAAFVGRGAQLFDVSDYPNAQAAIDAAPAGSTVRFTADAMLTTSLTISKALTLDSTSRRQITQTGAAAAAITVTVSDVTVRGLRITGRQFAASVAGEVAVSITGPSAAAPIERVTVEDCRITRWGMYGILATHVRGFRFAGNTVRDVSYAGISTLSCSFGVIATNHIANIVQNASPDSYGIALSRLSNVSDDLAVVPRTTDVLVTGNIVEGVAQWEGIDTHGGQRLTITGNMVKGCRIGIALVSCPNIAAVDTWAPLDCTVTGNTIDSGLTNGTAQAGIKIVGAAVVLGTPIEAATGTITGNTIRGHGPESNSLDGAIGAYITRGLVISGNTIHEPSPAGINLYHTNYDYVVTGNTIVDPWTETGTLGVGINVRSTFNTGLISGNSISRGLRVATHVSDVGVRVNTNDVSVVTTFGPNRTDGCVAALTDIGSRSTTTMRASNFSVYGAVAVPRAAAIVTPTAPGAAYVQAEAAAMKTAVDALRIAVKNIGITL